MDFAELVGAVDRAALAHLGSVPVVYRPEFGEPVEVDGIFDAQFVLVDAGEAGVESRVPAVFLRLEDLPTDPTLDREPTITVGGVGYQVIGRRPDGAGGVLLLLHLVD